MDQPDEQKVRKLCRSASTVLRMFKGGHHPTEYQLGKLEAAIMQFEMVKLCGHQLLDDCECLDIREAERQKE